ncbi:MAG: ATP-binding protein [Clostridia bacterium]
MFELSLHLLDLVQNAISAGAALVVIRIEIDTRRDVVVITLIDDGCGMDEALLKRVESPFATTRTTRKVGLGIPMFKQLAEMCEGEFFLTSAPGKGTTLRASFRYSCVDLPPLGDLTGTMRTLIQGAPDKPDFVLEYGRDGRAFTFDTREVREAMGGLSLNECDILAWIGDYIKEGLEQADAPTD